LIRVPKQEAEEKFESNNDAFTATDGGNNKRWNEKNYQDTENVSDEDSDIESDDEEEVVILRCHTTTCQDGNKCVPVEFDFVVRIRYGEEEDTPQAADTYFPYTMPYQSDEESFKNNFISKTSGENSDLSKEPKNTISASTDNLTINN